MAIYHCSIKIGSRSKGQSAVHAAAYRAGERLEDHYDGTVADYTRKHGIVYSEISMQPIIAKRHPEFYDREALWNAVEALENKSSSRLYREFECALPKELDRDQRVEVVREFVSVLVDQGMIVDWSMHEPKTGTQNYHAHIMATCRPCDPETGDWISGTKTRYAEDKDGNKIPVIDPGTGLQKVRIRPGKGVEKLWVRETVPGSGWDAKENIEKWRLAWEEATNHGLEKAGIDERVSRLRLQEQGIDRIPQIHVGVAANEIAVKQERGADIPFSNNGDTKDTVITGFKRLRKWLQNLLPVFTNRSGAVDKLGSALQSLIEHCNAVIHRAETKGVTRRELNDMIRTRNRAAELIESKIKQLEDELAELQAKQKEDRDEQKERELYDKLSELAARRERFATAQRDADRDRKRNEDEHNPEQPAGRAEHQDRRNGDTAGRVSTGDDTHVRRRR